MNIAKIVKYASRSLTPHLILPMESLMSLSSYDRSFRDDGAVIRWNWLVR